MIKPLSPDVIADLRRRLAAPGASLSSVARETKYNRETIRKYAGDVARAAKPPVDPVADAEARRGRARELSREREQLEAVAGERSFRAFLEQTLTGIVPEIDSPPPFREPKRTSESVDESLVLLLSDWHAYEIVKPERVYGLNEFNADVLGRRVWRVGNGVRSIVEKMRKGNWRFKRLVICANGDMISGTIHEVERHADAPNVIQAAIGCGLLLAQFIRDLAGTFETIEVFGTAGNHGRLPDARRVQQKDPTRSWDFLIYTVARLALADCPAVRFFLPNSYSVVFEVEGWRFAQNHGHDIRSWQSIPFYGISRTVTGLNALLTAKGVPINYFLYSHFHNPGSIAAPGGEYFVNGSLIGGTEYSVNGLGRADRPSQWLLGVHRDHGVTHRWPIQADGPGPAGTYDVRPWAEGGAA